MSGCRNPDALCSILSSLSPSLSRTFRDVAFSFRGIHVSEIHFRELSRKILKRIPYVSWQTHTETFVPRLPCESLKTLSELHAAHRLFLLLLLHLLLLHLLVLRSTLNHELQISVGTAGPQPRAPDFSGHCRTPSDRQISEGTARHRERQITVGTATLYRMGRGHPS